jgi:adenylate kinase
MPHPPDNIEAVLLLGPTATGKTPLGDLLARRGLWGRRCLHFDFGSNLRDAAAGRKHNSLPKKDIDVITWSLETGALLEDEHFPIAGRILSSFLADCGAGGDDLIVLNGLPRHVGQAECVEDVLHVAAVVCLQCTADVVRERIRTNAGGDRTERVDDDAAAVTRKLDIFAQRTAPLLDHYRTRGADVICIDIQTDTTPEDIRDVLDKRRPD